MNSTHGVAKSRTQLSDFHFPFTLVIQSCPTLRPLDCSPSGSLVRGISQEEYWSGLPFPSSEVLPNPHLLLDRQMLCS